MSSALLEYLAAEAITQQQLAERLGVRPATITAWKSGTKPRPEMMVRIEVITGGAVPVSSWFPRDGAEAGAGSEAA